MRHMWDWALLRIDPKPRDVMPAPPRFRWQAIAHEPMDWQPLDGSVEFESVVLKRRSTRVQTPASVSTVMNAVRDALRILKEGCGPLDGRYQKPTLSAGALHPIEAIILAPGDAPLLYDDLADVALRLSVANPDELARFLRRAAEVLPHARGAWILLAADVERTSSNYEAAQSLVWRDAGAALQMIALTCQARGLAFCPLGILGSDAPSAIHGQPTGPIGTGVAAIGLP